MLMTLRTLFSGAQARSEERLRDAYAIDLITQKIRESEAGLQAAKATLAALMQRQRIETSQKEALERSITDMSARIAEAIAKQRMDLAEPAAQALAQMENELAARQVTLDKLDARITRLRHGVETSHRRLLDLRQGLVQARAIRTERAASAKLHATGITPFDEAKALIDRVNSEDDPIVTSDILDEINRDLSTESLTDRLADAGIGAPTRVTAAAVLARFEK